MVKITELEGGKYKVEASLPAHKMQAERQDMPYPPKFSRKTWTATLSHNEDLTPAAEVKYVKRPGGVYIYSNNPEMMYAPDLNQMLLKNEHLTGECFFTYEHSNHTGEPFFLGYKLYNDGDKPVTVTVTNIGNQVRGEWLGQREWIDFYGMEFDLPTDYFLEDGKTVNPIYVGCDYVRYNPKPFVPETVTIAPGEYYWVIGGTTGDLDTGSWSGVTADQAILCGRCANGAVRFIIEGGELHGSFWCYTDPKECDITKPEQGYICKREGDDRNYAAQYKGIDRETKGLLEAEISFIVSDETKAGRLPVKYTVTRDPNWQKVKKPFAPLKMRKFKREGYDWMTALNPNDNHTAVGTDMIVFECVLPDGTPVIIDNEHTDGEALKANTGNWMVQYTTNYNFINAGDRTRRVKIFGHNTGVLMIIARDDKGNILEKKLNMQPYSFAKLEDAFAGVDKSLLVEKDGRWWFNVDGKPYIDVWDERSGMYEFDLPAKTAMRLSVDELILANSCGGVNHWVEVD